LRLRPDPLPADGQRSESSPEREVLTTYGSTAERRRRNQNLKPEDKTQRAKKGTKIGLLPKDEVMAVFRKIA
jgi:hypothetical protein